MAHNNLTCYYAGMLALPSFTAPAGLGPSTTLLVATWGLLTLEALLIAEVNLAVGEELRSKQFASGTSFRPADEGQMVTLRQMAEHTLGPAAGKGEHFQPAVSGEAFMQACRRLY